VYGVLETRDGSTYHTLPYYYFTPTVMNHDDRNHTLAVALYCLVFHYFLEIALDENLHLRLITHLLSPGSRPDWSTGPPQQ
jgi:hypothetical protein